MMLHHDIQMAKVWGSSCKQPLVLPDSLERPERRKKTLSKLQNSQKDICKVSAKCE